MTKKLINSDTGKLLTDIDTIVRRDGKLFYLQLKASNALIGGATAAKAPLGSLSDVKDWSAKALADLKKSDPTATYKQIEYVVPKGTIIPENVAEWFADKDIGITVIKDILLK